MSIRNFSIQSLKCQICFKISEVKQNKTKIKEKKSQDYKAGNELQSQKLTSFYICMPAVEPTIPISAAQVEPEKNFNRFWKFFPSHSDR